MLLGSLLHVSLALRVAPRYRRSVPKPGTAAYRQLQREGPDPILEADATFLLMARSTALRRRLLIGALAASLLAGAGTAVLYVAAASTIYGRVIGLAFALGGLLAFVILHRASRAIARRFEARWAGELARRHELSAEAITEALRVLD